METKSASAATGGYIASETEKKLTIILKEIEKADNIGGDCVTYWHEHHLVRNEVKVRLEEMGYRVPDNFDPATNPIIQVFWS